MHLRHFLAASVGSVSLACALAAPVHAQETTSSIRGEVSGENVALGGARVVVTHVPSGTTTTTTTDAGGNFTASGLRLGGPFTVAVTAGGYEQATITDIYLQAGQPQRLPVNLLTSSVIIVSAATQPSSIELSTGAATVLSENDIRGIANVNRDIRNLANRNPMVNLDPTNGGAISIAGQNNRFNRFSVDGVAFGDPFGLESGGLVSSRGPVPLDAIGEFSVEIAPADIQEGFFQGGAINAQLLSGTNRFTAMGGFFYTDDRLRGDEARGVTRTGEFESKIYTAQVTGPIIQDRLFFAVTWERLRDSVPAAISPDALGITDAQISQVQQIGQSVYGFDTQGVATAVPEEDDKVVAKLDFNIADGHRASATYIYNKGNVLAGQTGAGALNATNPNFSLQSNNYNQGAINHFGIFQMNNQWQDNFSTQLRVSYADYVRLQQPFGDASFGEFRTCLDPTPAAPTGTQTQAQAALACSTGGRQLTFGPDISRQANELDSQSMSVELQTNLQLGAHTIRLIAERRTQDIRNLFAQRVSGAWYFDSIADLQNRRANEVDIAVPLLGDIETVAAIFANNTWTFGLQDTVSVSDTLTATIGFRYDIFDTPDLPLNNPAFQNRFGFANTSTLNNRELFQPRFGLNWAATDRLTLRGSAGMFGGGSPNVWISNSYSNPGPTLGRAQVRRIPGVGGAPDTFTVSGIPGLTAAQAQAIGAATLNNVSGGTGIPQNLIAALVGTGGAAGAPTNALDPDFRVPSQWRVSGSADYEANFGPLGDDWNIGGDVVWSRVRNGLTWTDLRSVPVGTLPDGRIRYGVLPGQGTTTNTDILLTNSTEGYSWNLVGRFDKNWDNGLYLGGSYTFQRAKDVNPGTSSVAFSNYVNAAAGIDPNAAAYGTANYQRDDAFRLVLGYDAEIFGENNTRFELFFNSLSGQRYSYTFADQQSGGGRSNVFGVAGRNDRNLLYVPDVSSATADPLVTYAPGFDFVGFQNFIQNSELSEFQGQIAPKNLGRSPRYNKLDLSVRQELPFALGGRIELLADMENVLNFINSDWGTIRQVGFPYYGTLVNVTCASAPCTQYTYANRSSGGFAAPRENVNLNGSLWGVRFGARVRF